MKRKTKFVILGAVAVAIALVSLLYSAREARGQDIGEHIYALDAGSISDSSFGASDFNNVAEVNPPTSKLVPSNDEVLVGEVVGLVNDLDLFKNTTTGEYSLQFVEGVPSHREDQGQSNTRRRSLSSAQSRSLVVRDKTDVTLFASGGPESDSFTFTGWTGDCSGTLLECTLTSVTSEKTVTATWTKNSATEGDGEENDGE